MAARQSGIVLGQIHTLFNEGRIGTLTDAQLLERFAVQRAQAAEASEAAEAAFEAVVLRHGPMVLAVCRRVLRDPHDVEDAFQATFLILASVARDRSGSARFWGAGCARSRIGSLQERRRCQPAGFHSTRITWLQRLTSLN